MPLQSVKPDGQTQAPLLQNLPPVQTLPQRPQLLLSLSLLRQVPEQHMPPLAPNWEMQLVLQLPQ